MRDPRCQAFVVNEKPATFHVLGCVCDAHTSAERWRTVAAGPMPELLGSGFYFAPFDKLSAIDAGLLLEALASK